MTTGLALSTKLSMRKETNPWPRSGLLWLSAITQHCTGKWPSGLQHVGVRISPSCLNLNSLTVKGDVNEVENNCKNIAYCPFSDRLIGTLWIFFDSGFPQAY